MAPDKSNTEPAPCDQISTTKIITKLSGSCASQYYSKRMCFNQELHNPVHFHFTFLSCRRVVRGGCGPSRWVFRRTPWRLRLPAGTLERGARYARRRTYRRRGALEALETSCR